MFESINESTFRITAHTDNRLPGELSVQQQLLIYLASKNINLISANTGQNVTKEVADDPRQWVLRKVRRHLMRARKRHGFGWKRWSNQWVYEKLGLFNNYRVKYRGHC